MPDQPNPSCGHLLRTAEVRERLRVSRSTLQRMRRRHGFPKPRRLSTGVLVFDEAEIEDWLKRQPRAGHEAL